MKLILVGCEYAGKTTLANEIVKWIDHTMGGARGFHDHFTIPPSELTEEGPGAIPGVKSATQGTVPALCD